MPRRSSARATAAGSSAISPRFERIPGQQLRSLRVAFLLGDRAAIDQDPGPDAGIARWTKRRQRGHEVAIRSVPLAKSREHHRDLMVEQRLLPGISQAQGGLEVVSAPS